MQARMETTPRLVTARESAELDKLAELVRARQALRTACEQYTAYAKTSAARLTALEAAVGRSDAEVRRLEGVE